MTRTRRGYRCTTHERLKISNAELVGGPRFETVRLARQVLAESECGFECASEPIEHNGSVHVGSDGTMTRSALPMSEAKYIRFITVPAKKEPGPYGPGLGSSAWGRRRSPFREEGCMFAVAGLGRIHCDRVMQQSYNMRRRVGTAQRGSGHVSHALPATSSQCSREYSQCVRFHPLAAMLTKLRSSSAARWRRESRGTPARARPS